MTSKVGKGDIRSQRQRRRDRYRGCHVCGVRGEHCTECDLGVQLVAIHGYASLALMVDGSFVESSHDDLGHGGAGLVLVRGNEILTSRACGFRASSSSDAEFHAVIRAARWAPGVAIYTDAQDLPNKIIRSSPGLVVRYLPPHKRTEAHQLAHRLSVEGRCREAPETIPAIGLDFAGARDPHQGPAAKEGCGAAARTRAQGFRLRRRFHRARRASGLDVGEALA